MNQKGLSRMLKMIVIGIGLCGLAACFYVIPYYGKALAGKYPEFADAFWPWMIIVWLTAAPCYLVLWLGFRIARQIGLDNSFSDRNARDLKWISVLAVADAAFFFAANIVFLLLNRNHPALLLFSLLIMFAGVSVAVVAAAGSHLVHNAALLKEENDLTV